MFFYCEECDSISYKFSCCENTLCNGGGCEKCHPLHNELNNKIEKAILEHYPPLNLEELKGLFKDEASYLKFIEIIRNSFEKSIVINDEYIGTLYPGLPSLRGIRTILLIKRLNNEETKSS